MKYTAQVTRIKQETPTVRTVFFKVLSHDFSYTAGQYISIYFKDSNLLSGKAYSLSSAPEEKELSVTVKKIGDFSGRIHNLKPQDEFLISPAYGFFNVHSPAPIVAIVAGVGIAPVRSIICDELASNLARSIRVLLTAATSNELVFYNWLELKQRSSPNLIISLFTTQQAAKGATNRRLMVAKDIAPREISGAVFYLCGSEQFVRDIWRQLVGAGVSDERIVTEIFFEDAPWM